jgi:S-adenosylmethionine hydrolase
MQPLVLPEPQRSPAVVRGEVIYVDHFGNLITNIADEDLRALATPGVSVSIAGVSDVPLVSAYAHRPPGGVLAIINSWGLLEIAVRDGHAARQLGVALGTSVTVAPA